MKAKEYAAKYAALRRPDLEDEDFVSGIRNLFNEMLDEMISIIKTRRVSSYSALNATEKEFAQKARAINELLGHPLKEDWFSQLLAEVKRGVKS